LAKPKPAVASAALTCLRHFKLPYLTPYEDQIAALVSDSSNQVCGLHGDGR
jgi:hypothetical protein